MLLALLLAANPPVGSFYLNDEGVPKGLVSRINCSGSGVTCSVSAGYGTITVSGGGPGGGAPTDVAYWTAASSVDLSAEKNLGALSTGLVINTAGTPSAYAGTSCSNQFPRSLSASGAATCASVALGSDVTGTLAQSTGGTGAAALTCSAGQALTSNGTAYSCTSTLTASSVSGGNVSGAVATATALAADPADCTAGQYANAINASGTLACAQPAFSQLSGAATDSQVPDNITVTLAATATALAADPADCASNRYATAIAASGVLTCAQVDLAAGVTGTLPAANGGSTAVARVTTTNKTNATVTPATTGLSWAVAANTEYGFYCVITTTGTATALARFNLNGPAGATAVSFTTERYITTATQTLLVLQAFSAAAQTAACTSGCATTQLPVYIFGTILNGATGGTADLQFASSTAAQTVTVHRGSYCRVL